MKIDCFIMNPPYNGPGHQNFICRRITKEIKNLKPQKYIQICPNEANLFYKTAEFVCNPFGIRWSNIFIFDMLGNINEYFSFNEIPLWDKNSNKTLWMLENPAKVVLTETNNDTSKRRFKIKDNQETKDFIQWMNTDTKAKFFIKYIRTTLPSRYMYNRLWEIYNEIGHSNS